MTALHQGFVDVWMHEGYVSCTGTVSYDAQGDPGHLLFVFKEAEASREWGYRVPLGGTAAPRPSLDARRAAELLAVAKWGSLLSARRFIASASADAWRRQASRGSSAQCASSASERQNSPRCGERRGGAAAPGRKSYSTKQHKTRHGDHGPRDSRALGDAKAERIWITGAAEFSAIFRAR